MTAPQVKEQFETERLKIRKIVPTDTPHVFDTYASLKKSTKYISWPTHKSVEKDTLPFVDYALQAWNAGTDFTYLIFDLTGTPVGSIGFINEKGRVSFGYILGPAFWGKGFIVEVLNEMLPWFAAQVWVYRLWACCDVDNVASKRVLEKAGLQFEGRIADWAVFPNQKFKSKDCYFFHYPLMKR
ncbi:MAG: GNAT family N-acetyltransferase [Imperialibacter sp.]|uniref:GNAT family N-acetyltransferase n=1 Tax=Imperialibacter sp. TaxID=2038411 RepID=UPI0032EB9525